MSLDTRLDSLDPVFKPLAIELLARLVEAGIPVVIINTRRTPEQQESLLASGNSWTKNSKHLLGKAIDVCPYATYMAHGASKLQWDSTDINWRRIGQVGEALRLRWGGRFGPPAKPDLGHFEYVEQTPQILTDTELSTT